MLRTVQRSPVNRLGAAAATVPPGRTRAGGALATSVLMVGVALALVTVQPATAGAQEDHEDGVEHVDGRTAVTEDVALIAATKGWSLQRTREHLRVQETLSNLLVGLAAEYPASYASGVLATRPGQASVVRFKGAVPPGAAEDIAAAGIRVEIKGAAKYSAGELRDRSTAVIEHLADAGYIDVVTAVMPEGFIDVTVGGNPGAQPVLPADLRDDVRISLTDGAAGREEHTRGGAQLLNNNSFACTSGFTVTSFAGVTGVTTAAHCTNGIDEYNPPNGDPDYGLTFEAGHLGLFGDVQWHTSAHIEPNEFYATSSSIRTVTAVEPWAGIAGNSWYCVYGRASNNRQCDEVYSTFVNAWSGGVLVSSLVGMTDDNTVAGDSGGTWSFGTEATGGHRGDQWIWFKWRNVFSVADLYPVALGVTVQS